MSDLLKIGIVVLLFTLSMYLSHILVSILMPVLLFIAAIMLTLWISRMIITPGIAFRAHLALIILAVFIFSLIIAVILRDLVKVIAWFLIGWYIFRVLLYLLAEDMYKDLSELLDRIGGE